MPSIANQDYLRVNIFDLTALTTEEKTNLLDLHEKGLLFDTIIITADGDATYRIVSDEVNTSDTFSIVANGEIKQISVY